MFSMCSVCNADQALEQTHRGTHARFSRAEGLDLLVEATGVGAESEPGRLRFKRINDPDWTEWLDTESLSGSLGSLGTDVKFEYLKPEVAAYLEGGPLQPVLDMLSGEAEVLTGQKTQRLRWSKVFRAAQKRRVLARKKRLARLVNALPGWTLNGKTFRLGAWSLRLSEGYLSVGNRRKVTREWVAVRGPVEFTARLEDALRVVGALLAVAPESLQGT